MVQFWIAALSLAAAWVGSWLSQGIFHLIHNVFFNPLKAFPGPKLAGATTWWKTYIEVVKQQSMVDVLFELHKKYGNVVRVGPNEVQIFLSPNENEEWGESCADRNSCTSPIRRRIVIFTAPITDGTRRRRCTRLLAKTTRRLDCRRMQRPSSGRMSSSPCFLDARFLGCKILCEAT